MYQHWMPMALGMLIASLLALGGCGLNREQPTRLYVLTPVPHKEVASRSVRSPGPALGVGPIDVPQYLNRSSMVTGSSGYELYPATSAQWAEPLRDNFARVLAENLSLLLRTDRVVIFPWKGPVMLDYQVIVEVTHFLGDIGGETSLVALWSIVGKNGTEILVSQKSNIQVPTGTPGYEALAAAMSHAVAVLSQDIADALTALAQRASRHSFLPLASPPLASGQARAAPQRGAGKATGQA